MCQINIKLSSHDIITFLTEINKNANSWRWIKKFYSVSQKDQKLETHPMLSAIQLQMSIYDIITFSDLDTWDTWLQRMLLKYALNAVKCYLIETHLSCPPSNYNFQFMTSWQQEMGHLTPENAGHFTPSPVNDNIAINLPPKDKIIRRVWCHQILSNPILLISKHF